jgi:septin family protein
VFKGLISVTFELAIFSKTQVWDFYYTIKTMSSVASVVKQQVIISPQSNHIKLGIIGTTNVGKSSLFNMITRTQDKISPSENSLFRTTHPYIATFVPKDTRIEFISKVLGVEAVPVCITVADIAGLVPGSFAEVNNERFILLCLFL